MSIDRRSQTTDIRRQRSEVRPQTTDRRPQTADYKLWFPVFSLRSSVSGLQAAVCRLPSAAGFTLVELMLVVVIITVLAATVVPRLAGRTEQAKTARAKSDIAAIGLALDLYELDVGSYPTEGNLEALVKKDPPSGIDPAQWNGPYLKKGLPKDPWGRPYTYSPQSQHNQDYDLQSLGAKEGDANDDIGNWE